MLTMLVIVVFFAITIIIGTRKYDKHLRERFSNEFDMEAPSKNACPEEKAILRAAVKHSISRYLIEAERFAKTKSMSKDIDEVKENYKNEQDAKQDAKKAFALAKYFDLIPKEIETPEDFTSKV